MAAFHYKTAVITGGGSGINLAFAQALHKRGCAVLIVDLYLRPEAAEWLKATKGGAGSKTAFYKADVTSWEALESIFDYFATEFGGAPDLVVPGAGVYEASTPGFWNDADSPSHYKVLDINLNHPIKMTRIAIRKLKQAQKPGVILHLSSIAAQKASVTLPLYSVSKQALSQFVRCMAPLEDLCGIRVVAVAPGVVDTPLFRDSPQALAHIDMDKDFVLPPEEIVKAMLAVVADPKYPSGTVLEVGDIGNWREVTLLNDPGPQGRSTLPRAKAANAIILVEKALKDDENAT